jgi:hypothetical protein
VKDLGCLGIRVRTCTLGRRSLRSLRDLGCRAHQGAYSLRFGVQGSGFRVPWARVQGSEK